MHALPAAAAAVAAAVATAAHAVGAPQPQTVYPLPNTTISAFAQDGPLVAWFSASRNHCNTVHVRSLANGLQTVLPQRDARNVTCSWDVGSTRIGLALAGSSVLWTLREQSPIPFDYLLGANTNPGAHREHRYQEIAHTNSGSGLWLAGMAGDRSTLVYGVASVDYVDEAGCLAGTSPCTMRVVGGGVYRLAARPELIPGTDRTGAVAVAAWDGAVAYVAPDAVGKQGRPLAGADLPIEVVDATTGASISRVRPEGVPLALSLSRQLLATLERTPLGLRIAWYDRTTGAALGSSPVSSEASPELTATDRTIVYRVGRSIRAIDVATGKARTLAHAAADPVGLSLEGRRLAWAENLKGGARIRTLSIRP
jgi:hypothetical protein